MKKSFVVMLVISIILCSFSASYADDERTSGLFTYQIKGNGTLTITKFDWKNNSGDVYVPSMIDGYTVTAIGDEAFACDQNEQLPSVIITLPEGIKTIGSFAFRFAPISTIDIPSSVVLIGDGAFVGASIKKFGVAPGHDTFATIDGVLFNKQTKTLLAYPKNREEYLPIPEGILAIAPYAFAYCSFEGYKNYKIGLFFPESIKDIGDYAFTHCIFPSVCLLNSKDTIFDSGAGTLSVDSIGAHAFDSAIIGNDIGSSGTGRIVINTKTIGDGAFKDTTGRTLLLYINNCETIGNSAFDNAQKLIIILNEESGITSIGERAFYNTSVRGYPSTATTIPMNIENMTGYFDTFTDEPFVLPRDCKEIGASSFEGITAYNTGKNTVFVISSGIEVIPARAFAGAKNIYTVSFSEGCKTIDNNAFSEMANLETVEATSSTVEMIGNETFASCQALSEVGLPKTLKTIGTKAFASCPKLAKVSLPESVSQIGDQAFTRDVITITVKKGTYSDLWVQENGYTHEYFGEENEDTSWLNN